MNICLLGSLFYYKFLATGGVDINNDNNDDIGFRHSVKLANDIYGAMKSGKVISGMSKGAASANPYVAAAIIAWENRESIKKVAIFITAVLLIPIMFLMMLPSVIFNGFNSADSAAAFNNNSVVISNIEDAKVIIQNTLQTDHQSVEVEIKSLIASLPENAIGEIIPAYDAANYLDALLIISQYCVYKGDFKEISLTDLRETLAKAIGNLYTYTVSESAEEKIINEGQTTEEKIQITKYTYTIQYVGDDYFAANIFYLDEIMRQTANEYAQNLMLFLYGTNFAGGYAKVSDAVLAYESLIRLYAEKYGIPQFVEVIKAIMMQESGGRVPDVMQSSVCMYNLDYPKKPNGIPDPEYSIDAGIHYFADCLKMAGCTSPSDKSNLSLALQGYNFGSGYITWTLNNHGGYTETNAILFSNEMKAKLGWTNYGDTRYVAHVLRYYAYEGFGGAEGWGSPFVGKDWRKNVTSEFGTRTDPITGKESAYHDGLDIGYAQGTPINAVRAGRVITAIHSNSGFGNHLVIDHGDGTTALYGHCNKLLVSYEEQISIGQTIAEVGTTGRSTGNHLHLTIKVNGNAVNPRLYIK